MVEIVNTEYPSSPHFKDRSGQIIDGIKIIKYLGQDKNFNSVYQCECPHCGNIWDTRMNGIIAGTTKGCGCMSSRRESSIDKWESHIGETHNQLKIIGFERVWSGSRYRPHFICECSCGNIKSIRVQQVLEGKTISCGCKIKEVNRERLLNKSSNEDSKLMNKFSDNYITYEQKFDEINKPPIRYTFDIITWSKITGIPPHIILMRIIELKWDIEKALTTRCIDRFLGPIILNIGPFIQNNKPDKYNQSFHD